MAARWAIAASVLLCLAAGLGLSEATGTTQLAATIIRVLTTDGTLVVETNDPAVQVTVEGDGGLVITGAGLEEIRLRPGSYRVHADKDGRPIPLDKELVTVDRGGRAIVRVKLESSSAIPVSSAEKNAFVRLGGEGVAERRFDTLADAVIGATDGDTIEIHGNGPFVIGPMEFSRTLTIRAGAGFRPLIIDTPQTPPAASTDCLVSSQAPLRLEGLELRSTSNRVYKILQADGPLSVVNCRFLKLSPGVVISTYANCSLRNSELLAGTPIAIESLGNTTTVVTGCLLVGHSNLDDHDVTQLATVKFTGNTFLTAGSTRTVLLHIMYMPRAQVSESAAERLNLFASDNVFDSDQFVYQLFEPLTMNPKHTTDELETWLPRRVNWREERNLYALPNPLLGLLRQDSREVFLNLESSRGKNLNDWYRFWSLKDRGSSRGMIRFQGGDLRAKANANVTKLTPEDFRLRPDSAGYRAGKGGKDVGADVDLVGPGEAYERWKKTAEYQEWLKPTGHEK